MGKKSLLLISALLVLTGCAQPAQQEVLEPEPLPTYNIGEACDQPGEEVQGPDWPMLCTYVQGEWIYVQLAGDGVFPGQYELTQLPIEQCKITDQRPIEQRVEGGTSFPITGNRIPNSGELTIAIIPIDYPDYPGIEEPRTLMAETLKTIDAWNEFFTDNRIKYNWVVLDDWLRMPKEAKYYVEDKTYNNDGEILVKSDKQLQTKEEQIYQVFSEAEKVLDLDSLDAAFVLSNPEAKLVDFPLNYAKNQKVTTATKTYDLSFWSIGSYLWGNVPEFSHNRPVWTAMLHELGHAHGLAGHAPGNEWTFDVMTSGGTLNPWNGWIAGWIPDEDFVCLDGTRPATHKVLLDSVDLNRGGTIAAVVRLSDHEVLVVESRRKGPFSIDFQPGWGVIMAYVVDSKRVAQRFDFNLLREFDYFSYFARVENNPRPYNPEAYELDTNILGQFGETLVHENIRVTYTGSTNFDTVEIEVLK